MRLLEPKTRKGKAMPAKKFTADITLTFSSDQLNDWLCGHSVHTWANLRDSKGDWRNPSGWRFRYDREEDNEGDMKGRAVVRRADVARGLEKMAMGSPYLFGQMLNGNDDMESCDSLLQYIIFGKEIYG